MKKKSLLLILVTASSLVGLSLAAATKAGVFSCVNCAAHPKDDLQISVPKQHIAQLDYKDLYDKARLITVKVSIQNVSQGSGIIIQRKGQVYTVLTNEHVAKKGNRYIIKTDSGKEYPARRKENNLFGGNDLAILEFRSTDGSEYQTAVTGDSFNLRENDYVFAAGYPADGDPDYEGGFVLYRGRVLLRLNQPLRRGYQIGITNNFEKGMSGGPLVNDKGEVVGISGRHKALWGGVRNCSYRYQQDNSPACAHINEVRRAGVIVEPNSWTIPMEIFLEQAPPRLDLPQPSPFWVALNEKEKAESEWRKAKSPDNWNAVVSSWSRAIDFLGMIPRNHLKYEEAQGKIQQYRQNLDYAREMEEKSKADAEGLADRYYAGIGEAGEAWRTTQAKPDPEKSPQDWKEIAALWDKAFKLMEAVPANHPFYQDAQKKKSEYQRNIKYAEQQVSVSQ